MINERYGSADYFSTATCHHVTLNVTYIITYNGDACRVDILPYHKSVLLPALDISNQNINNIALKLFINNGEVQGSYRSHKLSTNKSAFVILEQYCVRWDRIDSVESNTLQSRGNRPTPTSMAKLINFLHIVQASTNS